MTGSCEMRCVLPARFEAVEEFIAGFRRKSQPLLNDAGGFTAELLVREALTNAVLHGCHADPGKQVRCWLRLKRRRLLLVVEDGGDGFDWRATRGRSANLADGSGRGIEILNKYASRVRYNRRGNAVAIIKRFS